jgi:hypothetical protein
MIEDLRRESSDKWIAERSSEMITTYKMSYLLADENYGLPPAAFNVPASAMTIRFAVDTTLPQTIKHLKPSRKCLPICLNGHYFESYADFGSEGNIIRQDLVEKLKLEVMRNVTVRYLDFLLEGGYSRMAEFCSIVNSRENMNLWDISNFSFQIALSFH